MIYIFLKAGPTAVMKRRGSREHNVLEVSLPHCNGELTKRLVCSD